MTTIESSVTPIHGTCTIGQPYGEPSTGYSCGFHTGIDFPASGTDSYDLYACCEGTVVYTYINSTGNTPALGNQVQIRRDDGIYFRYCHLEYGSITVTVGQRVSTLTKIGVMGNTGNSTGRHLHLEASTSQAWICNNFINPGEQLSIPNVRGTIVIYNGEIPPIPPTPPPQKIKKNNWVNLFKKKYNIKLY